MVNKSRLEQARDAYLAGNSEKIKKAHTHAAIHSKEEHITGFTLPEVILGGQDGLVNVLGVILGVAAATADPKIIIVAGLAAAFAESVSMGAVAYTSKIAEADYYQSEYEREKYEIEHYPEGEKEEIRTIYRRYGFSGKLLDDVVSTITSNEKVWIDIMMTQELKLEPIGRSAALPAGIIVGISAIIGSFIPLTPFFFLPIHQAIPLSLLVSGLTLFAVGYYKAKVTLGRNFLRQGIEMLTIGMVSALVGYFIGSLFKV